jgi:hypothetical protein
MMNKKSKAEHYYLCWILLALTRYTAGPHLFNTRDYRDICSAFDFRYFVFFSIRGNNQHFDRAITKLHSTFYSVVDQ